MKYSVEKIYEYVREIFGDNYIEGAYLNQEFIDGGEPIDYTDVYTNFDCQNYFTLENNMSIPIAWGATKLVIIPPHENYVIKIPFTGLYRGDMDEEGVFVNCHKVKDLEVENVCDQEIDMYENFTSDLQKIVLPLEFIGMLDNLPIYIQEKIKTTYEDSEDYASEFKYNKDGRFPAWYMIARYIMEEANYDRFHVIFLMRMMRQVGISITREIVNEVIDEITDIHTSNYGYTKDGRCVIFDIAGYGSEFYWYTDANGDYCGDEAI